MTVNAVNDAPVATDDGYEVDEDGTLTVDWWDSDWSHRQQLTFDNLAQTETLTDFPGLVILNSSNIDYAQTKDDGSDLRFFAADGTPLAYEIDQWNEAGDSSVWVRVPQIAGNSSSYDSARGGGISTQGALTITDGFLQVGSPTTAAAFAMSGGVFTGALLAGFSMDGWGIDMAYYVTGITVLILSLAATMMIGRYDARQASGAKSP